MASKRNIKLRACAGHKKYEDAEQAKYDAGAMQRRKGGAFDAYRCKRCGAIHVGKRPKRRTNRAHTRVE